MPPKEKNLNIHIILPTVDEILSEVVRVISNGKKQAIEIESVTQSPQDFLSATDNLLDYYHAQVRQYVYVINSYF